MKGKEKEIKTKKNQINQLINAYEEYIELLGEEIDELTPFANTHGWQSKKYEKGKLLRERIRSLKGVID